MQAWFEAYPLVTFLYLFGGLLFVYNKVFRTRKLPLLKEVMLLLIMGIGSGMLFLFQMDLGLPIAQCLTVALVLMFLVQIRYWVERRGKHE